MVYKGFAGMPDDYHLGKQDNTCNMHDDCKAANEKARAKGKVADHCHDECCEDCFGY